MQQSKKLKYMTKDQITVRIIVLIYLNARHSVNKIEKTSSFYLSNF